MIVKKLIDAVRGTADVEIPKNSESAVFELLIRRKTGYETKDGKIRISLKDFKRNKEELLKLGAKVICYHGLPRLFSRYGRRAGVYLGAAAAVLLIILSQRVVWRIDVTGCENITEESVVENLKELGFTYGTDFKKLDFDKLHNDYLRTYDDLSWISINMTGTVANVEVKELSEESDGDDGAIKNVVASEGGIIKLIEPHGGKVAVKIGDHVGKGDLLIGGVISYADKDTRYESSSGKVYAEVRREFSLEIAKLQTKKRYTGEEFEEKELIFFNFPLKLSRKYRISHNKYDKIYFNERIKLFGSVELPLSVSRTVFKEYEEETAVLGKAEAEAKFEELYSEKIGVWLDGARPVTVSFEETETDAGFIRKYEIICVADIAKEKAIAIN